MMTKGKHHLPGIGEGEDFNHRPHELPLEQFKGMLEMALLTAPPASVQESGGG